VNYENHQHLFVEGWRKISQRKSSKSLEEIFDAIQALDATICLTKESKEKTKMGRVLFSPVDMNKYLKTFLHEKGWTEKAKEGKKRKFVEPRHTFGKGRFREMDGIKNLVGLEIQFGKYAFIGYDIFSKMIIFKNLKYIECGVEIVPTHELAKQMSSGVSSFEQLLIEFEHRGESDIDIPVFVLSIGLTDEEKAKSKTLTELFKTNKIEALTKMKLREYHGSKPGPK